MQDEDEELVSDLNALCENEIWDIVIEKAHLTKTIRGKTRTAENVPLHTAISHNAPINVIQALVFAHPPMCAYRNKFGNTPLHFALWKNKGKDSLEVVSFLINYYPGATRIANNTNSYPLHWAAKFKAPVSIIQLVYKSFPQAVRKKNNKDETPLDLAISKFGKNHPVIAVLRGQTLDFHIDQPAANTSIDTSMIDTAEIWDEVDL